MWTRSGSLAAIIVKNGMMNCVMRCQYGPFCSQCRLAE